MSTADDNKAIYLEQYETTKVKISSTMFSDAYFNLSISFEPTSVGVSNGYTGHTFVADVNPTHYSHYILMTIGGKKYYLDCKWL